MKREIISGTLLTLLLTSVLTLAFCIQRVGAVSTPEIYMVPAANDFDLTTAPCHRWNITIWVKDIPEPGVFGYQFKCKFNSSWLEVTRAFELEWDPEWIFYYPQAGGGMPTPVIDNTLGFVLAQGWVLLGEPRFGAGPFKLGIVEFHIKVGPARFETLFSGLNVNNTDTILLDENLDEILAIKTDGYVRYAHTIPWDITGPTMWTPDSKCDIRDIALIALFYGSVEGDGRYDERADITGPTYLEPDGKIDVRDLALVAKHYGEIYP